MPAVSVRVTVLDDVGDREAPAGSKPWALWIVGQAALRRDELERDSSALRRLIGKMRKHEAWKALGVPSFDMLCTTKLKLSADEVEAIQASGRHQTLGIVLAKAQHARAQAVEVRQGASSFQRNDDADQRQRLRVSATPPSKNGPRLPRRLRGRRVQERS